MNQLTKFKIWVLEDNDTDFELLEMAIRETGLSVEVQRFTCGEQLVEQLNCPLRQTPKLVYLDLRMQGTGGMEVLQMLSKLEAFQFVPKLVFSTSANPKEVAKVYQLGGNAFHVKIVETPAMLELLKRMLNYWLLSVESVEFTVHRSE